MTEKQHCNHECVCGVLMVGGIEGDRSPCDFTGCKHDTRLLPPRITLPTPLTAHRDQNPRHFCVWVAGLGSLF
jgi:hypothetical protein